MEVSKIFVFALLFSLFTFLIGIYLGYMLNRYAFQIVYKEYESTKLMVESLQYLLLEKNVCDLTKFNILTNSLESLGNKIQILQNSNSIFLSKEDFRLLKAQYFNLEYLHYLLAKKQKQECNFTYDIILFFYDDSKPCELCKEEGYQLSLLKAEYGNKVLVYSFDISYPNAFISYYVKKYDITEVPSIVLFSNVTYVFKGFVSYKKLEKYII